MSKIMNYLNPTIGYAVFPYPTKRPLVLLVPVSDKLQDVSGKMMNVARKNHEMKRWETFRFVETYLMKTERFGFLGFRGYRFLTSTTFVPSSSVEYVLFGEPEIKNRPDVVKLIEKIKTTQPHVIFVTTAEADHARNALSAENRSGFKAPKITKKDIGYFETQTVMNMTHPQKQKVW